MNVSTISDVRAELARRRLTHRQLAESLGITATHLSYLLSRDWMVDLTPAGAARIAEAIESLSREAVAS